jgi:hypothetical protein
MALVVKKMTYAFSGVLRNYTGFHGKQNIRTNHKRSALSAFYFTATQSPKNMYVCRLIQKENVNEDFKTGYLGLCLYHHTVSVRFTA